MSVKVKIAASPSLSVGSLFVTSAFIVQAVLELVSPWAAKRARFFLLPWLSLLFLTSLGLNVVVIGDRVWLPGRVRPLRDVQSVVSFVRYAPHPTDRHSNVCAVRSPKGDVLARFSDPSEVASFLGVPLVVESI